MAGLMRLVVGLRLLSIAHGVALVSRTDSSPLRYSACYPDRGYTKDDAILAEKYLVQNATFDDGVYLTKNECIYHRADTTVVSVCNGSYRNRTITRAEVSRGIEQLQKDCGGGGTYNGVHVVNNLTFAAYGVTGPRPSVNPPGSPDPDLPTRIPKRDILYTEHNRRLHNRQDPVDPCKIIGINGVSRYDCLHKNYLAPDGSCAGEILPGNKCSVYCEVRRTGFLGVEQVPEGNEGLEIAPSTSRDLQDGTEVTISHGFSLGFEGVFKDVFGAGLTYEYSTSISTSKSTTKQSGLMPDRFYGRWVAFPKLMESCGSVSRREWVQDFGAPCGPGCIPVAGPGFCTGPVETLGNQCTMTPQLVDGVAQSLWTIRHETDIGKIAPMADQHPGYKKVCSVGEVPTNNPDGDPEIECQAPF